MNRNLIPGLLGIALGTVLAAANALGQPQPTTSSATSGKVAATFDHPDVTNPAVVEAFVDGVVKNHMQSAHSPSGVVAVMKNGKMIFSKGYGFRDVENRIPVEPESTLFRIGSISKLFTWVAVMQQVEQGNLDLDTDVNQYLRTFQIDDSWPGQPVTLRHILTHTAGFEDGAMGYLIIDDASRIIPLNQSLAKYQPQRVNAPGQHTAYSNWATALAGLIVANVSGVPFNDYVQRNIFDVLGMKNATFVEPLPPELDANMAKAYVYAEGRYKERNYEIISNFGPAGSVAATAHDMSFFAHALLKGGAFDGKRILKAETLQMMIDDGFAHDERVRGMGLGFLKRNYGPADFENFGHDGGTLIFNSHFGMSQKENFMLFSSFSGPGMQQTHKAFVKSFYDEFFPVEVTVVTPPADFSERAKRYEGTYHSWRSSFTKIESLWRMFVGVKVVSLPDNTLMIGETRYVEVDNNLFREVDDYGRVAFQEDANGKITGFVMDGFGVMQLYKAPFYETRVFTGSLVGLSLLIFVGVFLRLAYQWSDFRALQGTEKKAFVASISVAVTNFLFIIFASIGVSVGFIALMSELPAILKFSLIFPILATLAALYHVYCSVQVWRQGVLVSFWARVRYSLVTLCALFMAWFYYYWNLLGFNYFS
ncbi:class A beta-lactamase-related serine hydrolase [Seongchinamella unica]|uniref:Class A beta-lactamase-related serine hydrolase n=1 Tax=Seongchinamella unica TaxID=2547392 RepID=A0A4R5LTK9_9GAMM|nr:serine hydrolase domain-containing protein [Seongchinamella unica]TDG14699.1 class A beta-lactamase-related serine hydrolase [Seongchinamella unica]